jgi:hypothetical protein
MEHEWYNDNDKHVNSGGRRRITMENIRVSIQSDRKT